MFLIGDKNRMANHLASLARRDYCYVDDFGRVNLVMYIINCIMLCYAVLCYAMLRSVELC